MMEPDELEMFGLVPARGPGEMCDDQDYSIVQRPGVQTFARANDRLLVHVKDEFHVSWVLLDWTSSETNGANPTYQVAAHGSGPAGNLREPRHTYFGNDGYVFYVRPAVLAWAFGVLATWFDYDRR